jgi:zinc/manganese transport system substrate-binding protein
MHTCIKISLVTAFLSIAGPAHADVTVAATVPDLAAITKELGGKHVKVTALSLPTQDPHFVDAKPSLVLKLHKADLLIAVGLDLEIGWLPGLQTQARNDQIAQGGSGYLECSMYVGVKDMSGKADRSEGDVHPTGNPHYLYDPRAAAGCAKGIAAKLSQIDPDNSKTYSKNLKKFLAALDDAREGWEKRLAPYQGSAVVSYHKSMTYLVDWAGLTEVGTLEPKPGIPPTARHVASIIKTAKKAGAKVILEESYYPDKTGKLVAEKIGGSVVVVPGGTDVAAGESYIENMDHLVDDLEAALQ